MSGDTVYSSARDGFDDEQRRLDLMAQLYDPVSERYLRSIPLENARLIAELGPGSGSMAHYLMGRMTDGSKLHLVDNSFEFLGPLDERAIVRINADLNGFSFPGVDYDLIYSRSTIALIHQRDRLLDRIVEATAPEGWVLIEDVYKRQP